LRVDQNSTEDDWLDCAELQRVIFCSSGRHVDKIRVTEVVRFGNAGKSYSMRCELVILSPQYMCVLLDND
jgi:hypothetical protein